MPCRFKGALEIATLCMTARAKRLLRVARVAVRYPPFRVKAMRKAIVQTVDILQDHFLLSVIRAALCRRRRHRVFAVREVHEIGPVVAVLAEACSVARLTTHIVQPDSHELSVFLLETCDLVIFWQKRREVRVTRLADVCGLPVIVASIARLHRGKVGGAGILNVFQSLMTRFALHTRVAEVFLVRKNDLPRRICKGHQVFLIGMAERTVVLHFIFMTSSAVRLLGQEVI
jgi:hypothetical protein